MATLPNTASGGFLEVGAKRGSTRAVKGLFGPAFTGQLAEPDEIDLLTPDVEAEEPLQRPWDPAQKNPVRPSTGGSFSSWWSYVASFFSRGVMPPRIVTPTAHSLLKSSSSPIAPDRRKGKGVGRDEQNEESVDDLTQIKRAAVLADRNKDNRLDAEELLRLAEEVRERRRRKMTKEKMRKWDKDKNGKVSQQELIKKELAAAKLLDNKVEYLRIMKEDERGINDEYAEYLKLKFEAAKGGKSGELDMDELHVYVHPEIEAKVLEIEVGMQFRNADEDQDGRVSLKEFLVEARRGEDEDEFSSEAASTDFTTHDMDTSKSLDRAEFAEYLKGQVLLKKHVNIAMEAGDEDGDGLIHFEELMGSRKEAMLDSEFVEDYLLFHRRDEL